MSIHRNKHFASMCGECSGGTGMKSMWMDGGYEGRYRGRMDSMHALVGVR